MSNKLVLLGRTGSWGGIVKDIRQFIIVVFWILQTWASLRDLSAYYGDWKKLLDILVGNPDYEWLIIDAQSH